MLRLCFLVFSALCSACNAFTLNKFLKEIAAPATLSLSVLLPAQQPAFADKAPASWNKDISVEVLKNGNGIGVNPGDLVEIRFKGSYKGTEFDNTFKTEMPYIYRAGSERILKGLDDTVVNMKVGDRLAVSFGGDLAFGQKGRPSAPGKPRIPPMATVDYEVELVNLPGTQEDMIADVDD